jgi:hypothetical protein
LQENKAREYKMKNNKTLKYTFIFFGSIGMFLLSFTILYDLLIPDLCFYHTNKMNSVMNLFYSSGGASNGHPEPNILNLISSIFAGGFIGYKIYVLLVKIF